MCLYTGSVIKGRDDRKEQASPVSLNSMAGISYSGDPSDPSGLLGNTTYDPEADGGEDALYNKIEDESLNGPQGQNKSDLLVIDEEDMSLFSGGTEDEPWPEPSSFVSNPHVIIVNENDITVNGVSWDV